MSKPRKAAQRRPRIPKAAHRALQKRIAYDFKNQDLLAQAMTHASSETKGAGFADNERLEFLGDRVLGLMTADALAKAFPSAREGDLAPRLNALVRKETLAQIAREIDLGKCLVLSSGEDQSGGRDKPALLADACEALIAALYRDGGMRAARKFFDANWSERMKSTTIVPRDAKTKLQEWAQGSGLGVPIYTLVSRKGPDHAPVFVLEVRVEGRKSGCGKGGTKREAEQAAATVLLKAEGVSK